jgi:hypothetical protein
LKWRTRKNIIHYINWAFFKGISGNSA